MKKQGYTSEKFSIENTEWIQAKDLVAGDLGLGADGRDLVVTEVTIFERAETVYNFEVEEYHTYFVGEVGVWVHNVDKTYADGYNKERVILTMAKQYGWTPEEAAEYIRFKDSKTVEFSGPLKWINGGESQRIYDQIKSGKIKKEDIERDAISNESWEKSLSRKGKEILGYMSELKTKAINYFDSELSYKDPYPGIKINSGFDRTKNPKINHGAIDYDFGHKEEIPAAYSGTIAKIHTGCIAGDSKCGNGFGNHVRVIRPDNKLVIYGHFDSISSELKENQKIKKGTVLGRQGNTGNIESERGIAGPNNNYGSHLHLEMRDTESYTINPFNGSRGKYKGN